MDKLIRERNILNYKFKSNKEKPNLKYDIIRTALDIKGLSTTDNEMSTIDGNVEFIKLMKTIEIPKSNVKYPSKDSRLHVKVSVKKPVSNSDLSVNTHDIKQYTQLNHPSKIQADEQKPLAERLRKLSSLCKIMPFERKREEVDNIYRILKTINTLSSQMNDDVLKQLSQIVMYEYIDEPGITLFGNKGFYILISGVVKPLALPKVRMIGEPIHRFIQTQNEVESFPKMYPGECFGTLDEILLDDKDCSKLLLTETVEPSELIFVTTSYYRRIMEKYNTQKHADKLALLKAQEAFTVWPHLALVKIADIFSWTVIPVNTWICKENEISSVLAFIQEGSCNVLRKLEVTETLPNGKTITKIHQVVVGTLGKNKSLGEISLLDKSPMMHSLQVKEKIRAIQTNEQKLQNLDIDVKQLLHQSCSPEFYHITKEDVEKIYQKQKSEEDWDNFKEKIISDVINCCGIKTGQGKWNVVSNDKEVF